MSAVTFVTYLWHYLLARLVYDQLLRPLIHGHPSAALFTCCVGVLAFLAGRWSGRGRHRPAQAGHLTTRRRL